MMWAFLLAVGIFSGWWGALAFAAPPAKTNFAQSTTLKKSPMSISHDDGFPYDRIPTFALTTTRRYVLAARDATRKRDHERQTMDSLEPYRYYRISRLKTLSRRRPRPSERRPQEQDAAKYRRGLEEQEREENFEIVGWNADRAESSARLENFMNYQVTPISLRLVSDVGRPIEWDSSETANAVAIRQQEDAVEEVEEDKENADYEEKELEKDEVYGEEEEVRRAELENRRPENTALSLYPSVNEPSLARNPRHSSTQTPRDQTLSRAESFAAERSRAIRSTKQRSKNRTKANSPREQRKRCRNNNNNNNNRACRAQNWCPDVDVGNRAFLAPTVFEGKARSMSSLRKPGSNYAVTFEVKQVYKSQSGFQPLQKNDSVRLHFRDKTPGKSTLCSPENNGQRNQSGVVRANIKRGKVYLVFVNRVGPRNFTILGEPVIRSKKNEQAVQAVIRPDYVREVTLSELRNSVARLRERVKLVCRTRGSPPPRVHWLKDGTPLHPRRGLRIQHKRRRSKVVITSARVEDSGRYECVAESTSGHRASLAAELLVVHDTRVPETTTAAWPRQEQPCPIAGDFCMNGGTCLFFETVGEPACRCAEGFTGLRCETKDVISTGSVYNRHRVPFSCKLGLSTSYYC